LDQFIIDKNIINLLVPKKNYDLKYLNDMTAAAKETEATELKFGS
jgi:hypothetical protein